EVGPEIGGVGHAAPRVLPNSDVPNHVRRTFPEPLPRPLPEAERGEDQGHSPLPVSGRGRGKGSGNRFLALCRYPRASSGRFATPMTTASPRWTTAKPCDHTSAPDAARSFASQSGETSPDTKNSRRPSAAGRPNDS